MITVRFEHDLEDGWYSAYVGDLKIERNQWADLRAELGSEALLWVGSTYGKPVDFPNPPEFDEQVEQFLEEVRAELIRARMKFPGDRLMCLALAEEFGELCKAVLDEDSGNVRKEAVQTAVMCARVVLDGDGSVTDWREQKGLDKL